MGIPTNCVSHRVYRIVVTRKDNVDLYELAAVIQRRIESGDFALGEPGVAQKPIQGESYGQTEQVSVFISYASENKLTVRKLYLRLIACGYDVWYDEQSLLPGREWEREIRRAIIASDAFITVISCNSVDKGGFIQEELRLALDTAEGRPADTIFIVPLRIDDVEVPDRLKKWHVLDISIQGWFDRLVRSLNTRAG